jgi:hypothetical protein
MPRIGISKPDLKSLPGPAIRNRPVSAHLPSRVLSFHFGASAAVEIFQWNPNI